MVVAVKEKTDGRRERLLRLLTYEVVDGKPIYYRGYKEALKAMLSGEQPEESIGMSFWQARLLFEVGYLLERALRNKFVVAVGELGYWVERGKTWRNLDIAVFRYEDVKDKLESDEYVDVPPVLVVEIDVRAEVESEIGYMTEKTEQLLESGVEKVVWIFTKGERVLVAERGGDWVMRGWGEDTGLMEGLRLNLEELLRRG